MKKAIKTLIFIFGLTLVTSYVNAQSKYDDPNFDAVKVTSVMKQCEFKPQLITKDLFKFESLLNGLSDRAFYQLNIDTWAKCNKDQDRAFEIYNTLYKKVSRIYFQDNCKALIALMLMDGTLNSR
jgi:hypothetical protein